jgi:hypothetical protein
VSRVALPYRSRDPWCFAPPPAAAITSMNASLASTSSSNGAHANPPRQKSGSPPGSVLPIAVVEPVADGRRRVAIELLPDIGYPPSATANRNHQNKATPQRSRPPLIVTLCSQRPPRGRSSRLLRSVVKAGDPKGTGLRASLPPAETAANSCAACHLSTRRRRRHLIRGFLTAGRYSLCSASI